MFLLIDKPKRMTSHDVVDEVRKITGIRRVGHAGTLDPNATGLLVIGVGRESTKKLGSIAKDTRKTYEAEIFLGEERDTDDVLGEIRSTKSEILNNAQISKFKLVKTLKHFVGVQEQIPPAYSAIKVKGKKAYEMARKGKSLSLSPRNIEIFSIKLISYKYPLLKMVAEVSSGTYIRALARDIGRKLGCGAYLKNIRRTRIGKYDVKNAVKLDCLKI
jgi:tRNA pseudouridine55 synthase